MGPFDTVFPADSIEFCPHENATQIFVCGTYKLEQNEAIASKGSLFLDESIERRTPDVPRSQHRTGSCLVFEIERGKEFKKIQEFFLPAVLDMKWCHRPIAEAPILGIADSEGHISLHSWDVQQHHMTPLYTVSCATQDVLCLSLDWSNRRFSTSDIGSLVVSLSNGSICILRGDKQHDLSLTSSWVAHQYEAWISAWNYWDTNVLYSGGDDLTMKGWDIRQDCSHPTFVNKKFDAGVTTIQSHPHIEHLVAVGSYDNSVRLFDMRKPLAPLVVSNVGGGAWRVKWHPSEDRKHSLLVACMHDGFKVVNFDLTQPTLSTREPPWRITKHFEEHQSLAYGVDWSFAQMARSAEENTESLIASCSFYDHVLHLWSG